MAEQFPETRNRFVDERRQCLGGDVALGQARATGGDDRVNLRIVDPAFHLRAQTLDVVFQDDPCSDPVAGGLELVGDGVAGGVGLRGAGVGYGQGWPRSALRMAGRLCS